MTEFDLPLFEGIARNHVEWALRFFRMADVEVGMRLIEEGETDPTLLCVVHGELDIKTGDTPLGTADAGSIVGEMALFGTGQRMASVEARSKARILLLDRPGYTKLRDTNSPVALALEHFALEQLMQRLSDTSDAIAELAHGKQATAVVPQRGFFSAVRNLFGVGGPRRAPEVDPVKVMQATPFFSDALPDALAQIGDRMAPQAWSAGSFLCTEGTIGQEMYLLADGQVEVLISTGDERAEQLATLEPGDAFGMIALLDSRPRMASVVSRTPVTVLALGLTDWQDLVGANTPGGSAMRVAMIRCVSDQLAFANAQLAQLDLSRHLMDTLPGIRLAEAHMEAHGKQLTPAVPPDRPPAKPQPRR